MGPERLEALKVADIRDLLVPSPPTVGPDEPLENVLRILARTARSRHTYVVEETGHLIGVVRMNMIVELLFPHAALDQAGDDAFLGGRFLRSLEARVVRDIMDPDPRFVTLQTPLPAVGRILLEEKINELPVVDEGHRLMGQISVYDMICRCLEPSAPLLRGMRQVTREKGRATTQHGAD